MLSSLCVASFKIYRKDPSPMKNVFALTAVLALIFCFSGCKKFGSSASKAEIKTPMQQLSYCLGLDIGKSLKDLKTSIDVQAFTRGVEDNLSGKKPLIEEQQAEQIKQQAFMKIKADRAEFDKKAGEDNKKIEEKFLSENRKKPGVMTTMSGLQYIILKEGAGPAPKAMDKVSVHYVGTLLDGKEFDSSYKRGQPVTLPVGGVIPGWSEALQLMKVGSKYRLFIPSALAYADRGAPPVIEPNSMLIFEVDLLSIEK
jgi:FKBP-type peptidyl-prolyl cis-trans isomerase FkpA